MSFLTTRLPVRTSRIIYTHRDTFLRGQIHRKSFCLATRKMADTSTPVGQTISELAKAEGGPSKGSHAAQMQSEVTKQRNLEKDLGNNNIASTSGTANITPQEQSQMDREANYTQEADKVASKMQNAPETVTKEDANAIHSREHRAFGTTEKGGLASQAQSQVAANEGAKNNPDNFPTVNMTPQAQSQLDKEANFVQQADDVATKLQTDPASVTKEDADIMHSREQKAFGGTTAGGVASQAQSQVAENQGAKN